MQELGEKKLFKKKKSFRWSGWVELNFPSRAAVIQSESHSAAPPGSLDKWATEITGVNPVCKKKNSKSFFNFFFFFAGRWNSHGVFHPCQDLFCQLFAGTSDDSRMFWWGPQDVPLWAAPPPQQRRTQQFGFVFLTLSRWNDSVLRPELQLQDSSG